MLEDFKQYVGQTSDHSLEFELWEASGSYLYDQDGRPYLDFHSGVGVMNLGHNNRVVNGFIKDQLDHYSHTMVYGEHLQKSQIQYAKGLSLYFNSLSQEGTLNAGSSSQKQTFFTNTGNEAIDLAIKTARKATGKKGLVALEKGFHGRGYGSMQVTWNQDYKGGFYVDDGETDWINPMATDVEAELDKIEWDTKSAVFVEFVQGEAGAREVPTEFLRALRTRCSQEEVFFVADEVQTGFGRTGKLFAQETFGVVADITCLGKAGGGGLPFGAVVAERGLFEWLETPALSHISTFAGNPVVCAGGLGVLSQMTPQFLQQSQVVSSQLERGVQRLREKFPKVIEGYSGVGFLRGLHLVNESMVGLFYESAVRHGVLLHFKLNAGKVLRVSPPINISSEEVLSALNALEEACYDVQQELELK